jgi:hypothetical protein
MSSSKRRQNNQPFRGNPPSNNASLAAYFIFAFIWLLLPALYFLHHLRTPHDGLRLARGTAVFNQEGVVLSPYPGIEGRFAEGDILVAINGITIVERSQAFFRGDLRASVYETGQRPVYTILRDGSLLEVEVDLGKFPWKAMLIEHAGSLIFIILTQGLSLFVLLQRKKDLGAQTFFIWALSASCVYFWTVWLQVSDLLFGLSYWFFRFGTGPLWLIFWAATIHFLLVFPKPLVSTRRLRSWLLWIYAAPFITHLSYLFWQYHRYESLLPWWNAMQEGEYLMALLYVVLGFLLVGLQYRSVRTETERNKMRWVFFGLMSALFVDIGLNIIPNLIFGVTIVSPNVMGLLSFPLILSLVIAIWRHSLFDIQIIIRKTVVYGALTALLAFLYLGSITLLQMATNLVGGEQSSLVIVVSTLAIAAFFNPLRIRVQKSIDRRFYQQKYNAEQALNAFTNLSRSETDLDNLGDELKRLVSETLQPEQVSLWLVNRHRDEILT